MAAPSTSPTALPSLRAQRLLEAIHPVCSHDLPNQAVALQSLLQLFVWDEAEHLSPQGREYLQRLQSVAGKAFVYVQFLKEMARLQKQPSHPESQDVASLVGEIQAEMQRHFPEQSWKWELNCQVALVRADRRMLHQGLVNLLRSAALTQAVAAVQMRTLRQADHVAWEISVRFAERPPVADADALAIEQRLALALAKECLAVGDIDLRQVGGPSASFVLCFFERSPHG